MGTRRPASSHSPLPTDGHREAIQSPTWRRTVRLRRSDGDDVRAGSSYRCHFQPCRVVPGYPQEAIHIMVVQKADRSGAILHIPLVRTQEGVELVETPPAAPKVSRRARASGKSRIPVEISCGSGRSTTFQYTAVFGLALSPAVVSVSARVRGTTHRATFGADRSFLLAVPQAIEVRNLVVRDRLGRVLWHASRSCSSGTPFDL